MLARFHEITRCQEAIAAMDPGAALAGILPDGVAATLPSDPDGTIEGLRRERYRAATAAHDRSPAANGGLVRRAYYAVRPLLPVGVRKHFQRAALRGWDRIPFPAWPVDTTVERMVDGLWLRALEVTGSERLPFVWYWPDGHAAATIVTHDVETAVGRDFCGELMRMEAERGIVSSFEVVPEERYDVPEAWLDEIRAGGCEVCVHGLNHDGRLFSSEEVFRARAKRINEYARAFRAVGFRSPVMYRNPDWYDAFDFEYDMSFPNVAHLDPQRGGCCTVMPYFIGDLVELPLTMTQDYSLFQILREHSLDLWKRQLDVILARHGLASVIVHPDYVTAERPRATYAALLEHLAGLVAERDLWHALPRDVASWWRKRGAMFVAREGDAWRVKGFGAERARVGWVSRDGDGVRYEVTRGS